MATSASDTGANFKFPARRWIGRVACAAGFCLMFGVAAFAIPASTVVEGPFEQTSNEPVMLDWDAPTTGSIVGASGKTFVTGVGSLSDGRYPMVARAPKTAG